MENEPLNEPIFINDFMVNFENGYINSWYNESEDELQPAIDCIDGHIEYWEDGVLNRNNAPAVISAGDDKIEYWENGERIKKERYYPNNNDEENFKKGNEAEKDFAIYLNKNNIPFIHLDQCNKELYSKVFKEKSIKRPDYIIFLNNKPFFIDVKAISYYALNKNELERFNNLENEYAINVIFAIKNKNEKRNKFSFLTLKKIANYAEIIKNNKPDYNWEIYPVPDKLLDTDIVFNKIGNKELSDIFHEEKKKYIKNKFRYSDILKEYFNDEKYKIIKNKQNRT
jgi:hypothetical protein